LLVTIDTLRADHLPVYGYNKVKTPNLERFAGGSLIFDHAISHAPITLPSHTSIMTGRLPIGHGVLDNGGFTLDPKIPTLATLLKNKGYKTAAFVSAFVLDSIWQLDQGFETYFDRFDRSQMWDQSLGELQRRAEQTEIEAAHWLDENKNQRLFCWVHFYDPHEPYDPPEPYRTQYSGSLYDGEIAYTDEALGRLLEQVKQSHLEENTLIIITADHGEGLGEHNESTHSIFIYNTTVHVPLLIHLPGLHQRRVPQTVNHVDLAPTILEWLGIDPAPGIQGKSLIPLLEGKEKNDRTVLSMSAFAELHYGWSPLKSITTKQYKFIGIKPTSPGP
jgi:arylsulfatase A-like enzyme